MKTTSIKSELQELIERENDPNVLEAILILLKKTNVDPTLKDKLTSRALKAENDIKEGRIFNKSEAKTRINEWLDL